MIVPRHHPGSSNGYTASLFCLHTTQGTVSGKLNITAEGRQGTANISFDGASFSTGGSIDGLGFMEASRVSPPTLREHMSVFMMNKSSDHVDTRAVN